jgi:uncharacterized membrane protein YhaH (DUF805 family)
MWNVYFGEWSSGRLKRLPYLGYDVLLMVVAVIVILGTLMFVGGLDKISDVSSASLLEGMGLLTILFFFVFFIAAFVANLNIMAKRLRDMGLPAWGSVVAIILISFILEALFPNQQAQMSAVVAETQAGVSTAVDADASTGSIVSDIFNLIVFGCLVLIPSDTFGKKISESE